MRREKEKKIYWGESFKSQYNSKDYKSFYYKGNWNKQFLNNALDVAIKRHTGIYDAMYQIYENKKEHFPNKLVKFYPMNINSLKCVENDSIYLSEPCNFNDPYDCLLCANMDDFLKEYVLERISPEKNNVLQTEYDAILHSVTYDTDKRLMMNRPRMFSSVILNISVNNEYVGKVYTEAKVIFSNSLSELKKQEPVRVASFSYLDEIKLKTYLEMWGHYAESSKGFCVEYDLNMIWERALNNIDIRKIVSALHPCQYLSKPKQIPKIVMKKYALNLPMTIIERAKFERCILESYITKSSAWSYENEWRLVVEKNYCDIYNNLMPFPFISKMYLGCNMPKDNREYMYHLATRKGIKLFQMDLRDDSYELNSTEVDYCRYLEDKEWLQSAQLNRILVQEIARKNL